MRPAPLRMHPPFDAVTAEPWRSTPCTKKFMPSSSLSLATWPFFSQGEPSCLLIGPVKGLNPPLIFCSVASAIFFTSSGMLV